MPRSVRHITEIVQTSKLQSINKLTKSSFPYEDFIKTREQGYAEKMSHVHRKDVLAMTSYSSITHLII